MWNCPYQAAQGNVLLGHNCRCEMSISPEATFWLDLLMNGCVVVAAYGVWTNLRYRIWNNMGHYIWPIMAIGWRLLRFALLIGVLHSFFIVVQQLKHKAKEVCTQYGEWILDVASVPVLETEEGQE